MAPTYDSILYEHLESRVQQVPVVPEVPGAEPQTLEADIEVSANPDETSTLKDTSNEPGEQAVTVSQGPKA